MIKRFTILLFVLMSCVGMPFKALSADGYYDAFMTVTDAVNLTELRNAGLVITSRFDGIITAQVPEVFSPYDLKSFSGVMYAAPAVPLVTYCDSVRYYSRVNGVHEGFALDMPYTGKGVIVGVVDCGFDFNHVNLCDSAGNTRVKAVYLPLDNSGRTVMINRIVLPGSSFETPDAIRALTTDDPATTHGTQTAGIAAGSYRANGWYGIAPDADLVLCGMPEGELSDVRLAQCINYINDYAHRVGKPYVVNISLGNNVGPHNGNSYISKVIKQFAGPGSVFVVAAGNDGDEPVCIHESITSRQDTVTVLLSGYDGGSLRTGCINAWSDVGRHFNTRMIVADSRNGNILYRSRTLGTTTVGVVADFDTETDTDLGQYYTGTVKFTGAIETDGNGSSLMTVDMDAKQNYYVLGFQYFASSSTELDIWTSQYAYFSTYNLPWVSKGTSQGSISDLAANDSVISVGSYNTKQYVPLRDGTLYFRRNSRPFEMSYYSSYGPDQNGVARPDVCAPGSVVIASANRYDTEPHNLQFWQPSAFVDGVEYPYCPDLGTSMSAPVVAGAVALWLQADPTLSVADVREVLRNTSYKDAYVRSGNPARWGYGKLDINAGMRYVLHIEDKNGDVNGDGEVNVGDVNLVIDIILGGNVSPDIRRRADVNNDGEVNVNDINMIIDVIL